MHLQLRLKQLELSAFVKQAFGIATEPNGKPV
jgi:hypothetical protein